MSMLSRAWILGVALVVCLAGCSSTPQPWSRQEVREFTATVTAMDREQRMLSLQDDAGTAATLYVGPEVKNYDQIKVGDRVVATYHQAIAAAVTRPDQSVTEPQVSTETQRSNPGEAPRAEVSASLVATVAIEAVDPESNMLTFRRNDGHVRTVWVGDPGARKFIKGLKHGDLVTVTYTEALAIALRPVA